MMASGFHRRERPHDEHGAVNGDWGFQTGGHHVAALAGESFGVES